MTLPTLPEIPIPILIMIGIAFVVAISLWFYGTSKGIGTSVLDDAYHGYRVAWAGFVAIVIMAILFFVVATIKECSLEKSERTESLSFLPCKQYKSIQTFIKGFLPKEEEQTNL